MPAFQRAPIPTVVQQHVDDAAALRQMRSVLTRAPHVRLHLLRRLDDRLAASLDGVAVAGEFGRRLSQAALEAPGRGAVFAATVGAIEGRDPALLDSLLSVAQAQPDARAGAASAFGWVSAASLRGITRALFESANPFHRALGLDACAMHLVDPGAALDAALADPASQRQAIRVAGKLGRLDLLSACRAGLAHEDADHQFLAARAAALLGDRWAAVQALDDLAQQAGPQQEAAAQLVLKLLATAPAHVLLGSLAQQGAVPSRLLVRAVGAAGDPHYVPWLIQQMSERKLARPAGESFGMITGADIAALGLELASPEGEDLGPSDDPQDADVAMDEDESLPWPDPGKIAAWWQANARRFTPGNRYFVGAEPTAEHCRAVLRNGLQRQRIAAAEYLSLMRPGTPLFNAAAPAWRQARLLDRMEA